MEEEEEEKGRIKLENGSELERGPIKGGDNKK